MKTHSILIAAILAAGMAIPTFGAAASANTVAVQGNLSPLLPQATDLGHATERPIHIAWSLQLRNQAQLDQFLADVQNPASPVFHQFLTQAQFNDLYAPTTAQEQSVVDFLTASGFQVTQRFSNRLLVVAEAPTSVVERTFSTQIDNVLLGGESRYAATTEPTIPADLAGFTVGVSGLDDLGQAHAMHTTPAPAGPTPNSNLGTNCCYFAPPDLNVAYDEQHSTTNTGAGATGVIVGAYDYKDTDMATFDSQFSLPAPTVTRVCAGAAGSAGCAFDTSSSGNSIEITLDVEYMHGTVPSAAITSVMAASAAFTDFQTAYNQVVTGNYGHAVSTSWGACEQSMSASQRQADDNIFANGNAVGQSWFAASGDNGSKDCGILHTQIGVDYPASSPYIMGVGGTHLNCSSGMTSTSPLCGGYGSESAWTSGGGGNSIYYATPTWQTGCGYSGTARAVPDVSLESDTNPANLVAYNGGWNAVGGTSDAAPQLAGMFTALNAKLGGSGQGNPGTRLYQLCGTSAFHDVTSGSNGDFSAGAGYDRTTGVGTPDENVLLANWQSAPATAPAAPTLSASAGVNQVSLSWTDGSNGGSAITGHNVYRGTASGGETLLASNVAGSTYTDSAVTAGTAYFYQVTAVNAVGESARSNEASATPTAPTAPGAPTGLTATAGNAQVALSWTAPTNNGGSAITSYNVYRGTTSGGETLLASGVTTTSYTDASATNGVTYFYKVTAVNGVGESAQSNEASATPTAPPPATAPSAPQSLTAAHQGSPKSGKIALNWQAPTSNGGAAVTGYKIYRSTTSGTETLLTTVGNVLSYTDSGLTRGQTYFYKVTAVNSVGESVFSNEASASG